MGDFHAFECMSGYRDGQAKTRRYKSHAIEGGIIGDKNFYALNPQISQTDTDFLYFNQRSGDGKRGRVLADGHHCVHFWTLLTHFKTLGLELALFIHQPAKVHDESAKVHDESAKVHDESAKVRDESAKVRDEPAKVDDGLAKVRYGLASQSSSGRDHTFIFVLIT